MNSIHPKSSKYLGFITMREASELLGVSRSTLLRWMKAGILEYTRTHGGHRRIKYSALSRLAETNLNSKEKNPKYNKRKATGAAAKWAQRKKLLESIENQSSQSKQLERPEGSESPPADSPQPQKIEQPWHGFLERKPEDLRTEGSRQEVAALLPYCKQCGGDMLYGSTGFRCDACVKRTLLEIPDTSDTVNTVDDDPLGLGDL